MNLEELVEEFGSADNRDELRALVSELAEARERIAILVSKLGE